MYFRLPVCRYSILYSVPTYSTSFIPCLGLAHGLDEDTILTGTLTGTLTGDDDDMMI